MNFFEQELRKLTEACTGIENPVFAGRACLADLGGDNRIKLQFVTMGYADKYEAVLATVLNRKDGEVDRLTFRFADIWGRKMLGSRNFPEGVSPHIWTNGLKSDWHVYKPTDADFKQLGDVISAYLAVFTIREAVPKRTKRQTKGKPPIADRLAAGKAKADAHNAAKPADAPRRSTGETEH